MSDVLHPPFTPLNPDQKCGEVLPICAHGCETRHPPTPYTHACLDPHKNPRPTRASCTRTHFTSDSVKEPYLPESCCQWSVLLVHRSTGACWCLCCQRCQLSSVKVLLPAASAGAPIHLCLLVRPPSGIGVCGGAGCKKNGGLKSWRGAAKPGALPRTGPSPVVYGRFLSVSPPLFPPHFWGPAVEGAPAQAPA